MPPPYRSPTPKVPEYNPNGDSYNAYLGSQTPPALINQNAQKSINSKRAGGSPFEAMLTHATAYNQAMGKMRDPDANPVTPAPVTPPTPPTIPPTSGPRVIPTNPIADPTTPATVPGDPRNHQGGLTGTAPPPTPTGTGGTIAGNVPPPNPTTPRGPNGTLTNGNDNVPAIPGTEGWNDFARQKLNEYINGGYYFLKDNPNMLVAYWNDQGRTGEKGVDLPDWLAAQYPTIDWSKVPDNAKPGRAGYDTWRFTDANGTPRGFAPQSGPTTVAGNSRGGPATSPWIANTPGAPTSGSPYGADRSIQGVQDAAWQAAEDARKKAAADALAHPPQTPPAGTQTPPSTPPPVQPPPPSDTGFTPGPVIPPSSTVGGSTTTTNATTPGQATMPPPSDILAQERALLNPYFSQEQQELARQMNAQAVLTGDINAGTFNDAKLGRAQAQLTADQGKRLTDVAAAASESANQRMMQKYIADLGAGTEEKRIAAEQFAAQLSADVQREGIRTNAELERWAKTHEFDLQQKGIDANLFIEQYKADSAKEEGKYSADAAVNAARISAGAAHAAAGASAAAAKFAAQLQYQLGITNADVDRERNLMQFILGIGGLSNDQIKNLIAMSPDQFLGGQPVPPGTTVVKP